MPPVMNAQAILTSLHFVRAELVIAVDLYQEKIHHKILKEKLNAV